MRNIVIIQLAKLGDFIQSTPLLQSFDNAEITLICSDYSVKEAASLNTFINNIIFLDLKASNHTLTCPKELLPSKIDELYILNTNLTAVKLAKVIKAEKTFGPTLADNNKDIKYTQTQQMIMAFIQNRRLGNFNLVDIWKYLSSTPKNYSLYWPSTQSAPENMDTQTINLLVKNNNLVGIHPGSQSHLRRWPIENFAYLAKKLLDIGFTPVLTGSTKEKAMGQRLLALLGSDKNQVINLIGKLNLEQLAYVVSKQKLFISADTGVMHLAAALKVNVFALFFGPAYAQETAPYSENNLIYQGLAPCSPCLEECNCKLQCPSVPDKQIVSILANNFLNQKNNYFVQDMVNNYELWSTAMDDFGLYLKPLQKIALDKIAMLRLIMGQSGRKIISSDYNALHEFIKRLDNYHIKLKREDILDSKIIIKNIAKQAFSTEFMIKEKFIEDCYQMLKTLQ